jgi:kynureninase
MGTLTANLHLLLCSFYRPTKDRYKIMFESKAFPSDNYAFASQVEMHGYDKKDALVRVGPRKGEYCLRIEDILEAIEEQGDEGKS